MAGAALGLLAQAGMAIVAVVVVASAVAGHTGVLAFLPWGLANLLSCANSVYGLVAGQSVRRGDRWALRHVRVNMLLAFVLQGLAVGGFAGSPWAIPLLLIGSPWSVVYWVAMFVLSWHIRWDAGPRGVRSSDGRWWWDGAAWRPISGQPASAGLVGGPTIRPGIVAAGSAGCLAGGLAVAFGAVTAATSLAMVPALGSLLASGKIPSGSAVEFLWLPALLLLISFGLIAAPIGLGIHVVRSSQVSGIQALGAIDIGLGTLALLLLTSLMSLQLLVLHSPHVH